MSKICFRLSLLLNILCIITMIGGLKTSLVSPLRKTGSISMLIGSKQQPNFGQSKNEFKIEKSRRYCNSQTSSTSISLFNKIKDSPLSKTVFSWSCFGLLSYALKPFFPIVMGTFYFSVLGNSLVDSCYYLYKYIYSFFTKILPKNISKYTRVPRKFFVVLYIMVLFASIGRFCFYIFPRVLRDSQYILQVIKSEDPYTLFASAITQYFGADVSSRIENILASIAGEKGQQFAGYAALEAISPKDIAMTKRFGKMLQYYTTGYLNSVLSITSSIISNSTSAIYKAMLSLLFSIMIIWDLPQLKKAVQTLRKSRVAPIYAELAPRLTSFGEILAKSFEVSALIAFVNCFLTTTGLAILRIPGVGFFSLLTFVSSFIPVAGIFIATIPPLIVSLSEFGLHKCWQLLVMVAGVHAVESYFLYPQIYSLKLKIHPIFVLIALSIAEHYAGILGLFLALPVTLFLANQVLFPPLASKKPNSEIEEF